MSRSTEPRHRFIQKRTRLLRELKEASVAYVWHMNAATPQGRRAATFAATRLMRRSRDLWKLGTL